MNQEKRQCQNCKSEFIIEPDDFAFYEKMKVPPPTWCPECRMVRRMVWRNERTLSWHACALCGQNVLSSINPDAPVVGYCQECFESDRWDPLDLGRPVDWNIPFFEQYKGLLRETPRPLTYLNRSVQSEYANYIADSKSVYLSFSITEGSENVYYSKDIDAARDMFDSYGCAGSEQNYEVVDGAKNFRTMFAAHSRSCIDSAFLYDCVNCQHCLLCTGLRNKAYHIRNQPCSKEVYATMLQSLIGGSYASLQSTLSEFGRLIAVYPHRFASLVNCVDCIGDDLRDSKRALDTFNAYEMENVRYVFRSFNVKDSYDLTNCANSELIYEFMAGGGNGSSKVRFATATTSSLQETFYTDYCRSSSNLFGCAGLKSKHYCILNKEYPKGEYEDLVSRIKQHMMDMPYTDTKGRIYRYGEFFPPELSPFAYNETIAQEYFPLTKEQALSQGYRWRDPDTKDYKITKKPEDLPDHIKDVPDSITNEIIACAHANLLTYEVNKLGVGCNHQCTTAFKIIPEELAFYRRMNLPLPRLCPNCRHYERLKQRNPLKLWHRKCMCTGQTNNEQPTTDNGYRNTATHQHEAGKCPNEFETSYAPDRKEIVYCEQCYNAEVV